MSRRSSTSANMRYVRYFVESLLLVLALSPTEATFWSTECTSSSTPFASTGYDTEESGAIDSMVDNILSCGDGEKIVVKVDAEALQELQEMVAAVQTASAGDTGMRVARSRGLNLRYVCQNNFGLGCYVADVPRGAARRGDSDKIYNLQFSVADAEAIGEAINFDQFSAMADTASRVSARAGDGIDAAALDIISSIGAGWDMFMEKMNTVDVTPDNIGDTLTASVRSGATTRASTSVRSSTSKGITRG